MWSLTLREAKPTISRVIGQCQGSGSVADRANEAQQRLLNRADTPVGSLVEIRWCVTSTNCIVFPRQVRTVEEYAVCGAPGQVRPPWFQYIGYPNGPGYPTGTSLLGSTLIDKGTTCAFDEVRATETAPRRIAAIAANAADVGKQITLRYLDSTGNRVYTSIDSVVQEGERLTLVAPGLAFPGNAAVVSNNVASNGLYQVIKDTTQYPVYLYEYDPTVPVGPSSITKQLAAYEPSETNPIYRRAYVPILSQRGSCWANCTDSDDPDSDPPKTLTALVKLQHVPVVVDNDQFVIGNLAALKLMVMAILREEQNRLDESAALEAKARAELDGELSSYLGDGMRTALKVEGDWGGGYPCVDYGYGYSATW